MPRWPLVLISLLMGGCYSKCTDFDKYEGFGRNPYDLGPWDQDGAPQTIDRDGGRVLEHDAGRREPDASTQADAGRHDAGEPAALDAGGPVEACAGVPQFSEVQTYVAGDRVRAAGQLFQCRPGVAAGWCPLDSYEPGTGANWMMAWELLGECG